MMQDSFLRLLRLGIGTGSVTDLRLIANDVIDWPVLKTLADRQGLTAVVLDGIDRFTVNGSSFSVELPVTMKLEWIGEVLQNFERRFAQYEKAIESLVGFYNHHGFKMMVLKGYACSLDWPKPNHRPCGDIDIWQFGEQREADKVLENTNFADNINVRIDRSHHHHTVFEWNGFTVENHYDFVNVHAHRSSKELEVIFKELGQDDSHRIEVNGEKVYLPSANLHALFLIKHMVSHFAAAEIMLRQVLDWAFFVEKHTKEIDWEWLNGPLEKYHMKDFYNCINAICVDDLGFDLMIFPAIRFDPALKDRVLADILEPEYGSADSYGFVKRMAYKYRRWQGNAWKQKLCYPESRLEMFFTGLWSHIISPKIS